MFRAGKKTSDTRKQGKVSRQHSASKKSSFVVNKKTSTVSKRSTSSMNDIKKRQSPIDLTGDILQFDPILKPESIRINYELGDCTDLVVRPTGWQVNVAPEKCSSSFSANHISGEYRLAQFHAHWGSHGDNGSEHLVDGRALSGEVHFVFWNTKYGDFAEATRQDDGLAVVGVFLKESESDNTAYGPLVDTVRRAIDSPLQTAVFPPNCDIETMLPDNKDFYTYLGSLTTLPHSECVIWTVLRAPVPISNSQMKVFRRIVVDNSRTPQPLAGRTVRCSFED